MHEGVLVADIEARYPPLVHVGMIPVGYVDGTPAAGPGVFLVIIKVFQAMVYLDRKMEVVVGNRCFPIFHLKGFPILHLILK